MLLSHTSHLWLHLVCNHKFDIKVLMNAPPPHLPALLASFSSRIYYFVFVLMNAPPLHLPALPVAFSSQS
jgi:hypothetical protein